jgi:hypothetical protein
VFLSDIQQICSQLLQLTAGDADELGVQSTEANKCARVYGNSAYL